MKKAILFLCMLITLAVFGQHPMELKQVSEHIAIVGKHSDNGVMLRWAPQSFAVWQVASTNGYILERANWNDTIWPFEIGKLNFDALGTFTALKQHEWESMANINDPLVAVAAQGLFGSDATKAMPGGSFADLRLISEMQDNRHAVAMFAADMSADAAFALGLSYHDKSVEAGKDYIYRLRMPGNRAGFGVDTAYLFVQYDGLPTPVASVQAVTTESQNGRVDVMWDKYLNANFFTAYYVERSTNNKSFSRLNELPVTGAMGDDQSDANIYSDYTVEIGKRYYYRVVGITPFAETSAPGDAVVGIARDMEGPMPPQKVTLEQRDNTFVVLWEMDRNMIAPDAIGWVVKRSVTASGPYQALHDGVLPKKQREFVDKNPVPIMTNYYRVYAVDTAFNETPSMVYSAVWVDSIPPAAPAGLAAKVDSAGIVSIYWSQNKEIDLQGYRVFVRDDNNKDWYQLTQRPIIENSFFDTVDLKSLARSIQYTVIATDFHYNVSAYSNPFTLQLPDLVAPSAPRWAPWTMEDDHVKLSWYPSAASDVRVHRLIRNDDKGQMSLFKDFAPGENSHLAKIYGGVSAAFGLMAIDSAGNISDTVFLRNIVSTYVEKLPQIKDFKVDLLNEEKAIQLNWSYELENNISFVLYRKSQDGDETELVGRFNGQTRSYRDPGPTAFKQGFDYYLKAVADDGRESDWAEPVQIRFGKKD